MVLGCVLLNFIMSNRFLLKQKVFKFALVVCMCVFILCVYSYKISDVYEQLNKPYENGLIDSVKENENNHKYIVEQYYNKRENLKTSNIGTILFKNQNPKTELRNTTFVILIWKQWDWLKNRHVYNFGTTEHDPLDGCSVKNCKFTGDDEWLASADSVVVHLQRGLIPDTSIRNIRQRWIFLNDESPLHSFSLARNPPKISDLYNVFNWSMTYRTDADVPVPYGRTLPLADAIFAHSTLENIIQLVPYWDMKRRDILAAILISNCAASYRMKYLSELQNYIDVDVHGRCGDKDHINSCPGHYKADCEVLTQYMFYLVLENSLCQEYITEKIFHQAYAKGAIPIILGPSLEDCERLLPPNSFLHVDNFKSPKDLANEMIAISKSEENLISYHVWRNDFVVTNEHGYFGSKSYHLCRLCEAMNYNDESVSVYDERRIKSFLDPSETCVQK